MNRFLERGRVTSRHLKILASRKKKAHNRMINLNIICMCDNRQTDMLFELVVINERKYVLP